MGKLLTEEMSTCNITAKRLNKRMFNSQEAVLAKTRVWQRLNAMTRLRTRGRKWPRLVPRGAAPLLLVWRESSMQLADHVSSFAVVVVAIVNFLADKQGYCSILGILLRFRLILLSVNYRLHTDDGRLDVLKDDLYFIRGQ